MDYKHLINDIANKKINNLYLFFGEEKYLLNEALNKIKSLFINATNESFNLVYHDGLKTDIDELIDSCETLPFMGEKRIVIVKNLGVFSDKGTISEKSENKLTQYFANIPNTTCLIFLCDNIDKRKKVVKEINKYGVVVDFKKLDKKELYKWINNKFKKFNKKIEYSNLERFIEMLSYLEKGSDKTIYDVENEIVKICNFVGDRYNIDADDIEAVGSKTLENNIFLLVDAVAEKKGDLALKALSQMLLSGEPEAKILYMIIRQFKLLYRIKLMVSKGYTAIAIAPKFSLPKYIIKKNIKQASLFTCEDLLKILNKSLEADKSIKTGKMEPRLAIEVFITECCNFKQKS